MSSVNQFTRTEMLLGMDNIDKIKKSKVAVFGIGGVGSFCVEALARCGVENLTFIDNDVISVTNINRQIHSFHENIGQLKTEVMKERVLKINPNISVKIFNEFVLYNNIYNIINEHYDYVVDAVDTVTAKLAIIETCIKQDIPVISSMGTGNKIYPEMLEITDIYKTSVCPLAKVMRYELKKRGIKKLKVCYSSEIPIKPGLSSENLSKRTIPGSISFVPSTAGLLIAGEVIRNIIKKE